jgi:hypothetical protein
MGEIIRTVFLLVEDLWHFCVSDAIEGLSRILFGFENVGLFTIGELKKPSLLLFQVFNDLPNISDIYMCI